MPPGQIVRYEHQPIDNDVPGMSRPRRTPTPDVWVLCTGTFVNRFENFVQAFLFIAIDRVKP